MDDGPTPILDPPEIRRCSVCGKGASFGFGAPGSPAQPVEAWYCGSHREEGERVWTARYRASSLGPAVLL